MVAGNHDYVPADAKKKRDGFSYLTIEEFVKRFKGHGYDKAGERYWARQIVPGLRGIDLNDKEISGVNYFIAPSINSHPMRYTVFEITNRAVSWKCPMVGLRAQVDMEAKNNPMVLGNKNLG